MKYLTILLLFVCITSYAQEKELEIYLTNDSVVTTDWIKMHELPFFQKPYVRIDHKRGTKIKIEDIKSYKGTDQLGNYRELYRPGLQLGETNYYTELWFGTDSTEKLKIFYNQFLFARKGRPARICHTGFQLNDGAVKDLNYKNVNRCFDTLGYSNPSFKHARQFRFLQYVSVAVATGLLATVVYDKWPSPGNRSLEDQHNTLFLTSGCLVAFSLYLEIPKKRKLVKALKGYR